MVRCIIILLTVLFITSCPTPFGVLMGDSIMHYNGDDEKIEDWLQGDNPWIDDTDEEPELVDVTIYLDWGE